MPMVDRLSIAGDDLGESASRSLTKSFTRRLLSLDCAVESAARLELSFAFFDVSFILRP